MQLNCSHFIAGYLNAQQIVVGSVPNRSPDEVRPVRSAQKIARVDIIFLDTVFCSEKERKKVSGGNSRCWQKLARGTFSCYPLKPLLPGYPVVLAEQALLTSFKPRLRGAASNVLVQTERHDLYHWLVLQSAKGSQKNNSLTICNQ